MRWLCIYCGAAGVVADVVAELALGAEQGYSPGITIPWDIPSREYT